jgi:CBS domain-containing protein
MQRDLIELAARDVATVEAGCTLLEAARRMAERSVGCLVITDGSGRTPLGIVTDRDLVLLLARGGDPRGETVASLTTRPLETLRADESFQQAAHKMRKHGVRRLPIVDPDGRLAGIVSLDDLLVLLGRGMADLALAVEGELFQERGRSD